jgi:hypothetical protein
MTPGQLRDKVADRVQGMIEEREQWEQMIAQAERKG